LGRKGVSEIAHERSNQGRNVVNKAHTVRRGNQGRKVGSKAAHDGAVIRIVKRL